MKIFFIVIFNNIFKAFLLIIFIIECLCPLINIIEFFSSISQLKTKPIELNCEIQSYAE